MRIPVVPFLTPPQEAISHGGWLLCTVDGDIALPNEAVTLGLPNRFKACSSSFS